MREVIDEEERGETSRKKERQRRDGRGREEVEREETKSEIPVVIASIDHGTDDRFLHFGSSSRGNTRCRRPKQRLEKRRDRSGSSNKETI